MKIGVLILGVLMSFNAFAEARGGRELKCKYEMGTVSESQTIQLPEDIFKYTDQMQTFWLPVTFAVVDHKTKVTREVRITVAFDKIGVSSHISYLYLMINNLTALKQELFDSSLQNLNRQEITGKIDEEPFRVFCQLTVMAKSNW